MKKLIAFQENFASFVNIYIYALCWCMFNRVTLRTLTKVEWLKF